MAITGISTQSKLLFLLAGFFAGAAGAPPAWGAENGLALSPPLGWSSWSALETSIDENTIRTMAQAQAATLKSAGYVYHNVDGGWYLNPDLNVDANGRWIADASRFPSGMEALGNYIHALGLKFGLYVTPGIPKLAVTRNTPVEGTPYRASDIANTTKTEVTYLGGTMYSLDYTKPGSQEYIDSWANLFAQWGVDYLKLDAVGVSSAADVKAWSNALLQTGRPIYLALANNLDSSYADVWRQYSNSWRISTDIESYNGTTLTSWDHVALRFALEPNWLGAGGPGGWNDLDSLAVGGGHDGLTPDERQSMMTFWALSASPLIVGDDLRLLDDLGLRLLTNRDVISLHQNGIVASPLNAARSQQVWTALEPDGSYAVGLFNLADTAASVDVAWSSLGFAGPASVRDLWSSLDLGTFPETFSVPLSAHASRLLRVIPRTHILQRLAATALPQGGAVLSASTVGPKGQRVRSIGQGGTLTFPNLQISCGGVYDLTVTYVNGDSTARSAMLALNGTNYPMLTFPGMGDWGANLTQQGLTTTVLLTRGVNTLVFGNTSGLAPDMIGITLQRRSAMKGKTRSPECMNLAPPLDR